MSEKIKAYCSVCKDDVEYQETTFIDKNMKEYKAYSHYGKDHEDHLDKEFYDETMKG